MIAAPPLIADVTERPRRPLPSKAILWPTAIGHGDDAANADSARFPKWQAIKARKAAEIAEPLSAFVQAVRDAQDRILVLDDYLFDADERPTQSRIDQILKWFPLDLAANDIRILTNARGTSDERQNIERQLARRAAEINVSRAGATMSAIQVRFTLGNDFPYVHDRFAIVDDELWHFGATVGGLHHLVNAATRGWDVSQHDAVAFFEMAWQGDPDAGQEYHRNMRRGSRRA